MCRCILLGRDVLRPGEAGWAQLRFTQPAAAAPGDRFVAPVSYTHLLSPLHPCTAVETQGEVGGGARPGESLPAWAAALEPAEALEAHLRAWRVPILGRIHRGKLLLDVRTLLPGDEAEIAAALAAWRCV